MIQDAKLQKQTSQTLLETAAASNEKSSLVTHVLLTSGDVVPMDDFLDQAKAEETPPSSNVAPTEKSGLSTINEELTCELSAAQRELSAGGASPANSAHAAEPGQPSHSITAESLAARCQAITEGCQVIPAADAAVPLAARCEVAGCRCDLAEEPQATEVGTEANKPTAVDRQNASSPGALETELALSPAKVDEAAQNSAITPASRQSSSEAASYLEKVSPVLRKDTSLVQARGEARKQRIECCC